MVTESPLSAERPVNELEPAARSKARRAVTAAYQGYLIDQIDIYIPVIALAPAIAYFQPEHVPTETRTLIFYATFAATLLGRPIGAFIFGPVADRTGRRRTTLVAVAGFGTVTLLMGLLPGYAQWGMWSPLALICLRLLDGIFLGGEYTSATPLAFESVRRDKRGLLGGFLNASYSLAYVIVSLVTLGVMWLAPVGGADAPYTVWGWRIPFFFGAALAFVFLVYRIRNLPESEAWQRSERLKSPLRTVLVGEHARDFWQVFIMMTGLWLTALTVVPVVPSVLTHQAGIPGNTVTAALLAVNAVLFFVFVGVGALSQKVGRRNVAIVLGSVIGTGGSAVYYAFATAAAHGGAAALWSAGLIQVVVLSIWGIGTVYCNERFQTGARSSGFGLAYSLSVIIPSFYGVYMTLLGKVMPYELSPIVLLAIGALLSVIGAYLGPETKNIEISRAT